MLAPGDDTPLKFLRLILPERGFYIAAIKNPRSKGFRPSQFAPTIEDLFEIIRNADRDGYEVYHACASFKEARSDPPGTPDAEKRFGRTKHNVAGGRALWLDIDAGPGKPYGNQNAALDALARFCRVARLPHPLVVSSGAGLHVYWPLRHMLDRSTWERYASGLKPLSERLGLHADPARTGDITSVLRTPGTHNRKRTPVQLVECDPEFSDIGPYDIEQFGMLCADMPSAPPKRDSTVPSPPARRSRVIDRILSGTDYPPTLVAGIVERCGQLREFIEKKGVIPEPQWNDCLGVAAFCEDGETWAHDVSSGDPRYLYAETQGKLERKRALSGATTCKQFHGNNPATCAACPLWGKIKSPIVLGQRKEPIAAGGSAAVAVISQWERTQGGAIKAKSYTNAVVAIRELGIVCRHDVFHDRKIVEGDLAENLGPELSDAVCRAVRDRIIVRFGFDPGAVNVRDALESACEQNRFDPVLDYLDALRWDGQACLDRWMVTYMGADDSELTRTIGRLVLVAAVRRARKPGSKFDQITVLEGVEGSNKSTAIEVMAGKENFSDQTIIGLSDERVQERLAGKWLYEIADLAGMRKADVDQVKAFASRVNDRARGAYKHFTTEAARRCIFFATTNEPTYLKSQTGDRRFWPVRVQRIDIDALRRDRDQLWAEAAHVEAQGGSLALPEHLWSVARSEQAKRQEQDPWDDMLAEVKGEVHPATDREGREERISSMQLLRGYLGLEPGRITDRDSKRLGYSMRRRGWDGPKLMRIGGKPAKGYSRPVDDR